MRKYCLVAFMGLTLFCGGLSADQSLKSALGLSVDQARQVYEIEMRNQKPFAAKRTQRNNERRKLSRAELANDSKLIASQTLVVAKLTEELRQIQFAEDAEIRRLLTPEQLTKHDAYLKLRKEMKGSSRDARDF